MTSLASPRRKTPRAGRAARKHRKNDGGGPAAPCGEAYGKKSQRQDGAGGGCLHFYNDKALRGGYPCQKTERESEMQCRNCGSGTLVKNGFMSGAQRYKCKHCGFQFTRETPHGKPLRAKRLALVLYLSGLSMRMIGTIVGVSTQSVMRWITLLYTKVAARDRSPSQMEEIDADALVSCMTKKKDHIRIGKTPDHHT